MVGGRGRRALDAGAHDQDQLQGNVARGRILEAAYALFSRHGVHSVGIDRIIAEADVAKATLYHHFASKEALVIAFLKLREERWTRGWLEVEAERRAKAPEDRALAIFDALDEWFHRPDFEGCSFINTLLEVRDVRSPVRKEIHRRLDVIRGILERFLEEAAVRNPREVAYQLQNLMIGAIVSASRADVDAARRMKPLVAGLLESSRR